MAEDEHQHGHFRGNDERQKARVNNHRKEPRKSKAIKHRAGLQRTGPKKTKTQITLADVYHGLHFVLFVRLVCTISMPVASLLT